MPFGARHGFPHPLLTIPGDWLRDPGPRYEVPSYGRGFSRGRYSRFYGRAAP